MTHPLLVELGLSIHEITYQQCTTCKNLVCQIYTVCRVTQVTQYNQHDQVCLKYGMLNIGIHNISSISVLVLLPYDDVPTGSSQH
jgi:hypothetical protein